VAVYKRFTRSKSGKTGSRKVVPRTELQSMWEQRIAEGEMVKEHWKKEFGVDALESAYYGHQKPDHWKAKDWFTLNLIFASVKVLMRNICPRDLRIRMKLSKSFLSDVNMIPPLERLVQLRQAVLQYFANRLKLWKEGRLAYLNSLWQFGCLKVGYSAEMEDNENAGAVVQDRDGAIVYDPDSGLPLIEPDKIPLTEEFFIDQVDPDMIVVDRYCRNDLDKTGRWVAEKIFRSVEDLQNDPYYSRKATKDLEPSSLYDTERMKLQGSVSYRAMWQHDAGTELPENEVVVLYEVYDLYNKQVLTIARGAKDLLRKPEPMPPGVNLHPYVFLKFYEKRDSFYPIPVIYNWWGAQHEYNLTRNQFTLHRKRFNRKYLYDSNKIDPDEVDKLIEGDDGTFARAQGSGAVEPVKDAPLDSAVYFDTKQFREEFTELTGVGQLQRAMLGAESATEAEIVERRSREGEVDEHEETMHFLSAVTKKLHDSMEANLTQEGAVEFVGPAGAQWMSFGPEHFDEISGEVLFQTTAEEAAKVTLQVERAQMLQMLEIIARNPMLALDDVLLRAVVNKFPAFADNELLIQRLQGLGQLMLQIQVMEAQQKNQTKQVKSTSTGKEASKSRQVATGR